MEQTRKLNKFDSLYNKFIFQWSEGKPLGDIVKILKNDSQEQCCCNDQMNCQDNCQCSCEQSLTDSDTQKDNECCSQDDVKNCFYQKFPKFLVIKCQNKFPLEDDIEVPNEITNRFWDANKEAILAVLLKCAKELIADEMTKELVTLFGAQNEYNEEAFNEPALELVSSME